MVMNDVRLAGEGANSRTEKLNEVAQFLVQSPSDKSVEIE